MRRLLAKFGVVDASDRSEALVRATKSYIDTRASIACKDVTRQFDLMTQAHAEYVAAGGGALDEELLKSNFLSALPSAYNEVKMNIRTRLSSFEDLDSLYEAVMAMCKPIETESTRSSVGAGFAARGRGASRGRGRSCVA